MYRLVVNRETARRLMLPPTALFARLPLSSTRVRSFAMKRRPLPPPVTLTSQAQKFFQALHSQKPDTGGFRLSLEQADNNMHMQFEFEFLTKTDAEQSKNERVVFDDEKKLALHVDESALMKVLGSTIDFDDQRLIVLDKQGFELSPET